MENSRICKACGVEKPLTKFHTCKHCTGGTIGVCKICKSKGLKVPKDYKVPKFNHNWSSPEGRMLSIQGVSKQDYLVMYDLMKVCGYDVEGDVHQQFLDKWNKISKKPMKYKKRTERRYQNTYLPNGERNPLKIKNPTD